MTKDDAFCIDKSLYASKLLLFNALAGPAVSKTDLFSDSLMFLDHVLKPI